MSCLSIIGSGTTISHAATTASVDLPKNAAGKYPQFIRVAATTAAYVKLGYGRAATGTAVMKAVSVTVNTAGTGYAVNDTITLTGGTSTQAVILTVTGETGGAIDSVEITNDGAYTVLPSDPVAQGSTSGSGTTADFNIDWGVESVTVTGAGTGYQDGVAVTFSGGSGSGAAATAVTNTAGAVQSVTVSAAGSGYTSTPTVAIGATLSAAAGDILVQPGDAVTLLSSGATTLASIRVSADGITQISAVEDVIR